MKKIVFIGLGIAALIGVVVFYYLKFKKKKPTALVTTQGSQVSTDDIQDVVATYPDFVYYPPVNVVNNVGDYIVTDIIVPMMQQLNQVNLDFLGDFDIPIHPVTGDPVFSNLYAGPNFRQQIGNPLRKGYSSIAHGVMIEGVERQMNNKQVNFISIIPPKRRVVSYTTGQDLKLHSTATAADILSVDYSAYNDIGGSMAGNIATFFNGSATKAEIGNVDLDIENGIFNLPDTDLANRLVALYEQFKSGCEAYTKVTLLYQALPIQHVGFGVHRHHYTDQPTPFWTQPVTMTQNAIDKHLPVGLLGKSLHTLPYIQCLFEFYPKYESGLPEGAILLNIDDTPLRNFAGVDISVHTHFGLESPSYMHPAAHMAAGIQVNKRHLNGKTLRVQTSTFNLGGDGYIYGHVADNQPRNTLIKQCNDGMGRYLMPIRITQYNAMIAYFSGAKFTNWDDTKPIVPVNRSEGEYVAQNENETSRKDYTGVAAQQAVVKRLSLQKFAVGNHLVSVSDLIDGTEIYTDQRTKVNYLTVPNFSVPKYIDALDWKEFKLSPVLSIVNEAKRLVAILHFQAFNCEQSVLDYHYDENGFSFQKRLQTPPDTINVSIFELSEVMQ